MTVCENCGAGSWQSVIVEIKFKQLLRIVGEYQYLCTPIM
jgi:hypothetical protein